MSISVGNISLDMVLNSAQFKKQMSDIKSQSNSFSTSIAGSFKKARAAIVAAFSVAAIKNFGQECIESAAEVQAANSQFAQTFGDLQTQANQAMKAVANESKITQSRLQGVGTSIFAFAKTTGMDSAQALTMMQDALKVTADSAAYYDRSLEDTAESLKSFLKGNFENDAALGLSCTETTRNTAANKLYGKSFKDLSESQKQLTLLQMVKDANALSGALGQASRESDGWENVLGNLKETWNQFLAVVGKPVLQGAVFVVKQMTSALATLTEYAKSAISSLSKLFGWDTETVTGNISNTAVSVGAITSEADNSSESLNNVAESAEKVKGSVAGFDKLNILSKKSSGSNSSSNTSITPSSSSIANNPISNTVDSLSKNISDVFKNLYENSGLKIFVDKIQKGINSVNWNSTKENFNSIFNNLKSIAESSFKDVQNVSKSSFETLGSYISGASSIYGKALETVSGGIAKWINRDKVKITDFISDISTNLTKGFDNLSSFFDDWFGIIGESMDRMRPEMENSISNLLSGLTDYGGAVGTVISGAFKIATASIAKWVKKDREEISLFFDNLQTNASEAMNILGGNYFVLGTAISTWWDSYGSKVFQGICEMSTNIGTTLMKVYNEWNSVRTFFGEWGKAISTTWSNILSPLVNWLVDLLAPVVINTVTSIKEHFDTTFKFIGVILTGFYERLRGLCDFITGAFLVAWEKALQGVKDAFDAVWEHGILETVKTVINLMIDYINDLWSGVYSALSGIVNSLGGIASTAGELIGKDWSFSMPDEPALIPKLAKGGIVKAPTLAVVGDNAGANTGNPEVVAPLHRLQSMINTSSGQDVVILSQILDFLKRIYEMFVVFRNQGGNMYEFVATLNGSVLFEELVRQNELYKKRHNGKSAFA